MYISVCIKRKLLRYCIHKIRTRHCERETESKGKKGLLEIKIPKYDCDNKKLSEELQERWKQERRKGGGRSGI